MEWRKQRNSKCKLPELELWLSCLRKGKKTSLTRVVKEGMVRAEEEQVNKAYEFFNWDTFLKNCKKYKLYEKANI